MEMVNGYVFLDLTKSNVYSKALKVLGTDKPVIIKDGSGSPYFVDSLTLSGTNVVITKGGKTITIANDNTITNVGDIQNHLYEYVFSFTETNSNKGYYCKFDCTINTDNITDLLNILNDDKAINIICHNVDKAVLPCITIYYDDENTMFIDELYDREQNLEFAISTATFIQKVQLF